MERQSLHVTGDTGSSQLDLQTRLHPSQNPSEAFCGRQCPDTDLSFPPWPSRPPQGGASAQGPAQGGSVLTWGALSVTGSLGLLAASLLPRAVRAGGAGSFALQPPLLPHACEDRRTGDPRLGHCSQSQSHTRRVPLTFLDEVLLVNRYPGPQHPPPRVFTRCYSCFPRNKAPCAPKPSLAVGRRRGLLFAGRRGAGPHQRLLTCNSY